MNPLFLALLAAGIVLVVGVLMYNWLQDRRARRRLENAFTRPPAEAADGRDRIEPELSLDETGASQSAAVEDAQETEVTSPEYEMVDAEPVAIPATSAERSGIAPDPDIECVVLMRPQQPVATSALARALATQLPKPLRWLGRRAPGAPWQPIDRDRPGPWHEVAACLLLANRAGSASRPEIETFIRLTTDIASSVASAFAPPDAAAEANRAGELDRFCADLDVQIGLTLLKGELGQIAGTRLRGVAEAAGFRMSPAGHFEYLQEETGSPLYSLQNYKQEPFTAENMRLLSTPGVVFILDVPRVSDPVRVFDHMRLAAKRMAQTLEGVLVDDNRRPITDASLSAIRSQVQATAVALREANIDPGGPRALRLFG